MTEITTDNLPSLCDLAMRDLAEVKSIGECLNIRNVMEAARVYSQKHRMAQEAQDACTKIVVMAERRIGLAIVEARKRGELASQGRHSDPNVICLDDLNINDVDRKKFTDASLLDDADIQDVMSEAQASGKPARKSGFKRRAGQKRRGVSSSVPPKPEHLTHFALWLRNGSKIVGQFMDHREAMSLCGRHGIAIDPEQVRVILEFLAALSAGLEADRAA